MLERPTHYDDVVSGDKQSSLLTAIGRLRSAFSQHTLVFFVPSGSNIEVSFLRLLLLRPFLRLLLFLLLLLLLLLLKECSR